MTRPPLRVLIADDHETVREGLRFIVDAQADMTVVGEAATGQEAIDRARAVAPDIVVLDLSMPGMSGLTAASTLVRSRAGLSVVVLTRHDDEAFVQQLRDIGVAAYVLKQNSSSELLRAIRIAAAGGQYVSPAIAEPERDPRRRLSTPRVTERETEVLRLVASGHSNRDIAAALDITVKTVEVHKANAMRKLGLHGRTDVVRYAALNGWLDDL